MPYILPGWRPLAALFVLCLVPAPVLAQDSRLTLPTIAASAAAAADWASTYHALKNYHVREINPLLRQFESSPGRLVTVGAVMDGAAFSAWNMAMGKRHPRIAVAGLWAVAGFRTYLAVHNMRNIRRAARR